MQFLEEFMSTRLGVRRTAEVVSAVAREGPGGRTYYDIQTRVGGGCCWPRAAFAGCVPGGKLSSGPLQGVG